MELPLRVHMDLNLVGQDGHLWSRDLSSGHWSQERGHVRPAGSPVWFFGTAGAFPGRRPSGRVGLQAGLAPQAKPVSKTGLTSATRPMVSPPIWHTLTWAPPMYLTRRAFLLLLSLTFCSLLQTERLAQADKLSQHEKLFQHEKLSQHRRAVLSVQKTPPASQASAEGRVRAEMPLDDKPIIWFGGGLGYGASQETLAGHLELALHGEGPNVYTARSALVTDILQHHGRDFSLLYGRAAGRAMALAGIGVAQVDDGTDWTTAPGLALQGRLRAGTLGPWGLGLTAFANVNPEASFAGLTLTLELGNF